MLSTDIPTRDDVVELATARNDASVSIYLPTSPLPAGSDAERLELRNLADDAVGRLRAAGTDKRELARIEEAVEALLDDGFFWRHQSHSLALFVTPDRLITFRLPNRLSTALEVSDRFFVKPLLRAVTFPQEAFVLALAQGSVRLVEVTADAPAVDVAHADLPRDVASAVGLPSIAGRSPEKRIQGSEGQKVRMTQYARAVDAGVRAVLAGHTTPLVLAATEPLAGIYRGVNTYRHLLSETIAGSPEELSDAELADASRAILDAHYALELARLRSTFEDRVSAGKAVTDLSDVARAATAGAVEFLLVDIDRSVPGQVDEQTGAVTPAADDERTSHGVLDEIARRTLLTGGRVVAVRAQDVPGTTGVAAALRYRV